ncbi:MAG TPA: hypothetical protein VL326_32465 [Kofleriaceae bacterium]|nr:hypothetical protein [Kofleriaceae bacterium]
MRTFALLASVLLFACGPSSMRGDDDDGNGNTQPDSGVNSGSGNEDGCSDAAKLIYVVDNNNKLSSFDGATKTFKDLGTLSCPAASGAQPFSMGVDRNAMAYVLYSGVDPLSGDVTSTEIFKVDTTQANLPCTKTSFTGTAEFKQFGMGFSTDAAMGSNDTLYIVGSPGVGTGTAKLATLDVTTMQATMKGPVSGDPELTGTGSAELWGFFPSDEAGTTDPRISKLDKATGTSSTSYTLAALKGPPAAWAFAFWGGDYWVFLAKSSGGLFPTPGKTVVYQVDGTNGTIKGQTDTMTRTIVGAGVSTCAPVVIL